MAANELAAMDLIKSFFPDCSFGYRFNPKFSQVLQLVGIGASLWRTSSVDYNDKGSWKESPLGSLRDWPEYSDKKSTVQKIVLHYSDQRRALYSRERDAGSRWAAGAGSAVRLRSEHSTSHPLGAGP